MRQLGPQGIGISYSGQSYQERASSGDAALIFGLGLLIVFLVLAAQYESWSVPFAVILGVPFGVLGALLGIWIRGQPNDIYFQVEPGIDAINGIRLDHFRFVKGVKIDIGQVESIKEYIKRGIGTISPGSGDGTTVKFHQLFLEIDSEMAEA